MIIVMKTDPNFDGIYFTTGILKPKALRKFKKVLKVENGKVFTTDGGSLFVSPVTLGDGYYQLIKRTKTLVVLEDTKCDAYPEIADIININYQYTIDTSIIDYEKGKGNGYAYYIALINKAGFIIIPDRVNNVFSAGDFEISYNKLTEPVRFKHESGKQAYIMPMVPL